MWSVISTSAPAETLYPISSESTRVWQEHTIRSSRNKDIKNAVAVAQYTIPKIVVKFSLNIILKDHRDKNCKDINTFQTTSTFKLEALGIHGFYPIL